MPAAVASPQADDIFAELQDISGVDTALWKDMLAQPEVDQRDLVLGWRALGKIGWAQRVDTGARVLALLNLLGTIAGDVSGVAGAIGAVQEITKL